MKKVFIGADESYDPVDNGVFVMVFVMILNEKDNEYIHNYVEKILNKKEMPEFKNNKISDTLRRKILSKFESVKYINYVYKDEIKSPKDILEINYKNGLKKFAECLRDNLTDCTIDIKLDMVSGKTFQNKCIKIILETIKKSENKNIKIKIKYAKSEISAIVQYADIFAGEIRVGNKSKVRSIVNKNKHLL